MRSYLAIPAIALAAAAAFADNGTGAHFLSADGSVNSIGALSVAYSEAGLGQQNIHLTLTADATATWACINGGNKHPQASNKATAQTTVSAGQDAKVKNGRASGTITAGPPDMPSGFSCPSGQDLVFACVSYSDVVLRDDTNAVEQDIAGTLSRTFVSIKGVSC